MCSLRAIELPTRLGHRTGQPDRLLGLVVLRSQEPGQARRPQSSLHVVAVNAEVLLCGLDERLFFGRKRGLLGIFEISLKDRLQFTRLDARFPLFLARGLHHHRLQPP